MVSTLITLVEIKAFITRCYSLYEHFMLLKLEQVEHSVLSERRSFVGSELDRLVRLLDRCDSAESL